MGGVTTKENAWKQKSSPQKALTLLLPGLGQAGDTVPREEWGRVSASSLQLSALVSNVNKFREGGTELQTSHMGNARR